MDEVAGSNPAPPTTADAGFCEVASTASFFCLKFALEQGVQSAADFLEGREHLVSVGVQRGGMGPYLSCLLSPMLTETA